MTNEVAEIGQCILNFLTNQPKMPWLPCPSRTSIELLADGVYHVNFVVRCEGATAVARYNRVSQWGLTRTGQLLREYTVLQDLSGSGIAPRPIALNLDVKYPFAVESYVEGQTFDYHEDLEELAATVAKAHACPPKASERHLPKTPATKFLATDALTLIERAEHFGGPTQSTRLLRSAHLSLARDKLPPSGPAVLLHTDLIQPNILRTPTRCVLVDWEGARIGPREWDLAYLLSPVTLRWARPMIDPDSVEHASFLQSYAMFAEVDADELERAVSSLLPYVILRALSWCVAYAASFPETSDHVASRLEMFGTADFIEQHLIAKVNP